MEDENGNTVSKNIEEIEAGDNVWSRDEATGEECFKPVVETYVRETDMLVHLSYKATEGEEATLVGTAEHPFWSLTRNKWVNMGELVHGERLRLSGGEARVTATRVEKLAEPVKVFNFQVADSHTYFAAPATGLSFVWVHNANYDTAGIPKGFKSRGQFNQFGEATHGSLSKPGLADAQAFMQGSAVTGRSFRTGLPFDVGRVSDFDIALVGSDIASRARKLGVAFKDGGFTKLSLTDDAIESLGLSLMRSKLSRLAGGRTVNFRIYESLDAMRARGAHMWIPKR